jgi:hypothetical protein
MRGFLFQRAFTRASRLPGDEADSVSAPARSRIGNGSVERIVVGIGGHRVRLRRAVVYGANQGGYCPFPSELLAEGRNSRIRWPGCRWNSPARLAPAQAARPSSPVRSRRLDRGLTLLGLELRVDLSPRPVPANAKRLLQFFGRRSFSNAHSKLELGDGLRPDRGFDSPTSGWRGLRNVLRPSRRRSPAARLPSRLFLVELEERAAAVG